MAYDEELAARVRDVISGEPGITEQRMFGGLAFLLHGHLAVGASGEGGLMVRVARADTEDLVDGQHTRPMEMRGRPMSGWLRVDGAGLTDDADLNRWVGLGVAYARSLPPKPGRG